MKKLKSGWKKTRVFIDSSVLFSAVRSVTGGSAKIIYWAGLGKVECVVSKNVVAEVEKNVGDKLPREYWPRLENLLEALDIDSRTTTRLEMEKTAGVVVRKDAFVLADARRNRVSYSVTLDKKHILTEKVRKLMAPVLVIAPGEFIRDYEINMKRRLTTR